MTAACWPTIKEPAMPRTSSSPDPSAFREHAQRLSEIAVQLRQCSGNLAWSGEEADRIRHAMLKEAGHCEEAAADLTAVAVALEGHAAAAQERIAPVGRCPRNADADRRAPSFDRAMRCR
jgi:hypothetical protein